VLAAEATREPVHLGLWAKRIGLIALMIAALAAPFFIYPTFLMKVLCFALFAAAFNLLLGYVGLLSFGHAAFFGAATYGTGLVMKTWGVGPEIGLLAGIATGGILGLLFGAVAIRRQGIYFAMITLALSQLIYFIAVQAGFTGGEDGLQSVPRGKLFGLIDLTDVMPMYYFTLAVFVLGYLFVQRVVSSPFGEVIRSIRDNEDRARSLGYATSRYKLAAFTLSASIAGLAGGLKVLVVGVASLSDVHWHANGEVVLMALLGGIGTVFGPLLGAATLVSLQNYLAPLGSWVFIAQGIIFVLCVLLFRDGLVGLFSRTWVNWMQRKRRVSDVPACSSNGLQ
jgi:branched-chain amino acid transport system permease protein